MKITNVLEFKTLYETIKDKKLPIKVSYKMAKLLQQLEMEINFYQEKIAAIVQEYGKKDERGNLVTVESGVFEIQEGKLSECNAKIEELAALEIQPIDIKFSFDELETLELSIQEINCLMPFLEE